MTVEADLTALLRTVLPRFYPDIVPADKPRPHGAYHQIGGQSPTFLDGSLPSKENGEFQITVYADTRAEAKSLIKQIEVVLNGAAQFIARPVAAPRSDYEHDVSAYVASQDWSIWSDR